jgi:hypothetical protein
MTLLEDVDVKDLPPFAQELVGLIGFVPTIRLVELRPGIPFYVPDTMHQDHWLAVELGMKAAEALVKNFNGLTITPPNCKLAMTKIRQRHIVQSRGKGYSQTEAALLHGVTPRWVRELESREPEQEKNLRLF